MGFSVLKTDDMDSPPLYRRREALESLHVVAEIDDVLLERFRGECFELVRFPEIKRERWDSRCSH